MKVKELVELLKDIDQEAEISICGCYGSIGDIEEVTEELTREGKSCNIYSDICSG